MRVTLSDAIPGSGPKYCVPRPVTDYPAMLLEMIDDTHLLMLLTSMTVALMIISLVHLLSYMLDRQAFCLLAFLDRAHNLMRNGFLSLPLRLVASTLYYSMSRCFT